MPMFNSSNSLNAIILCGGKGTRLRGIIDGVPKPLAEVAGEPFLDKLLRLLVESKQIDRVILAAGYLGEQIRDRYAGMYQSLPVEVIIEDEPLGTGGAIHNAMTRVSTTEYFVLNGDSFSGVHLAAMFAYHSGHGQPVTIATCGSKDPRRYGLLKVDPGTRRILQFSEKMPDAKEGSINLGVYIIKKAWAEKSFVEKKFSVEEFFASNVRIYDFRAFHVDAPFIDIGTPESYFESQEFFK